MKGILRWITKHMAIVLIASVIYMLSFHLSCLNFTKVFFYDGIVRLIIVFSVILLCEILFASKLSFDYKDIVLSVGVFVLLNMLWFSLCVVSLDRSLSVFVLCYIDEVESLSGEEISERELEEIFSDVFVDEYGMLERRYEEQIVSGNIQKGEQGYKLTDRGELMTNIFRIVGKMYNVDKRFIYPDVKGSQNLY